MARCWLVHHDYLGRDGRQGLWSLVRRHIYVALLHFFLNELFSRLTSFGLTRKLPGLLLTGATQPTEANCVALAFQLDAPELPGLSIVEVERALAHNMSS